VSQFVIPVPHKARDKLQRESKHCFFDLKMDAHVRGHDMLLFKLRHYLRVAFLDTSVTLPSMRLAIISDIHGNLEGLTKAFEIIDAKKIDQVYCLGDIVGYGANPNECISMLRARNVLSIIGNHDQAVIDAEKAGSLNDFARQAIDWTARQLTPESFTFLSRLPYTIVAHDCTFVHASPDEPHEWNYILSAYEAHEQFRFFSTSICWIGHSHRSSIFCEDLKTKKVEKEKRYIINVGSVGQPRNGDSRLSFGIFDTDRWEYEHVVSVYDVELARQKIIEAGLPLYLADRLLFGA